MYSRSVKSQDRRQPQRMKKSKDRRAFSRTARNKDGINSRSKIDRGGIRL